MQLVETKTTNSVSLVVPPSSDDDGDGDVSMDDLGDPPPGVTTTTNTTNTVSEVNPKAKVDYDVIDIDEDDDDDDMTLTSTPQAQAQAQALQEAQTSTSTSTSTPPIKEIKDGDGDDTNKIQNDDGDEDDIFDNGNKIINPKTGEVEMRDLEKEQEELKNMLRQIGRNELEDIILKKIVECINSHTTIGHLRAKCLHLHGLKDKLFQKSGVLQKQVSELSKALKQYSDNAAKSPSQQKPPPPLKFYRSVGLQVNVETCSKNPIPRINNTVRMTNSNSTAFMQQMSNGPTTISPPSNNNNNNHNNNNIMSPPSGMKRVNKPTITVAELRNQVGRSDPPKMARNNSSNSILAQSRPGQQHQQVIMPRNPAAGAAINAMNAAAAAAASGRKGTNTASSGLIDLTDDKNNGGGLILNQNGMQYRVLNQNGIPQGMQLVSSSAGYHLVSPQGQSRPVVFQQAGTGAIRQISPGQGQTLGSLHGVNRPGAVMQQQQQQRTIPPPNRVVTARVPVPNNTMMNGNHHQVLLGQKTQLQATPPRTFALPILPAPTTPMVQQRTKATKEKPPQPELTLQEQDGGIVLSWTHKIGQNHAEIQSYQIFACQQPLNPTGAPLAPAWKRVGDVKALPLPMACTLSQFSDENRYHFIVRGLDVYNRSGPFCEIVSIVLRKKR